MLKNHDLLARLRTLLTCLIALACVSSASAHAAESGELCAHCESALAPEPLQYVAPSRNFATRHVSLDLDLDLEAQSIAGSVTHTLECLRPGTTELRLNAVALSIDAVSIDGQPVVFDYPEPDFQEAAPDSFWAAFGQLGDDHDGLVVHSTAPLQRGQTITLRVDYHGAPKEGLYFITTEPGLTGSRPEVWSQGQGARNRYWIPCFDYPNEKATFDGTFRVDKPYYVLSNGRLESTQDLGAKTQYRWVLEQPQVAYLIMLAAGEYEIYTDNWRGKEVSYLVPPGTGEARTRANLGLTVDMLDFFSDTIGIEYPYDKYAQVVVQNFIFGGMENTTATVLNSRCLYDERALLDRDAENLVAHELAHQWWGDMVTLREWNQMWLNEGFATFFEKLYKQHHRGQDEYIYDLDGAHREVIAADKTNPRPMVVDFFNRTDATSSSHVYTKGASVLAMLRQYLGDEVFFDALRRYGTEMQWKNAETQDLMRAFREASGENVDWFFEQWVYLAGHPDLTVSKSWDAGRSTLTLHLEQTQPLSELGPVFRLPLQIEFDCAGQPQPYQVLMTKQSQDFYFKLPSEPLMTLVDKGGTTLMTLSFPRPVAELVYQLEHADTYGRIEAARALGELGPNEAAAKALAACLASEAFRRLRAEAATALGKNNSEVAAQSLFAGLADGESVVRTACVTALGKLKLSADVEQKLLGLLDNDVSYEVRKAALIALRELKSEQAYAASIGALGQDSMNEVIRQAAAEQLGKLEKTEALPQLKTLAAAGNERRYRHEALSSYAKLAKRLEDEKERKAAADYLVSMLTDWYPNTRQAAIGALVELGDKSAVEALNRMADQDPRQGLRRQAHEAAAKLQAQTSDVTSIKDLQAELKLLRDEVQALKEGFAEVKERLPEEPK